MGNGQDGTETDEENQKIANRMYNNPMKMDQESRKTLNSLAQMLEFVDINEIMRVVAEKVLLNLAYTNCEAGSIAPG